MSKKNKRGPQNKVQASIYRKRIDEMVSQGVKPVAISVWLKGQDPPESIGKSAIYDYINAEFDVEGEAVRQFSDLKSRERLDGAVDQRVGEIVKLQAFADMALDVGLDLDIVVDERTSVLDVEKHKLNVIRVGVSAQRVVNDFLKGVEPQAVNVSVGLSVHERIREYERRFRAARDGGDSGDGV